MGMLILGWHGGIKAREYEDYGVGYSSHDGAAVLLRDGRLVAAIEEERLNRVKHSNFFPEKAIRFCLDQAGARLDEVDAIVADVAEPVLDSFAALEFLMEPDQRALTGRAMLAGIFQRSFGLDVTDRIRFCPHHHAHLHAAVAMAGPDRALGLCLDGEGDGMAGMVTLLDGHAIQELRRIPAHQSLGDFYTRVISLLGFKRFDEYKAMGLAPYGDPTVFGPLFRSFYTLEPEGGFTLKPLEQMMMGAAQAGLVHTARRKGQEFTRQHMDIAAALQAALEDIVFHMVRHFQAVTGARTLVFTGGVAHNCTLNGKLLNTGLFDRVFAQPIAHDAGNALGAALAVRVQATGRGLDAPLPHLYLGRDLPDTAEIGRRLAAWAPLVEATQEADIATVMAGRLAEGAVIGWVQGRSEFGPRALGNRSILADPRPAENKNRINAMVKKREGFRPFAPAVVQDRLHDYYKVPAGVDALPFMIFIVEVKEEARDLLGATTHVDGTARVQTVSADGNPHFHALLSRFGERTGVPVLLNTSFNNNAEPIVDSVDDAVTCFLSTGIDELAVGDWRVRKAALAPDDPLWLTLVPRLPAWRKLVRRTAADGTPAHGIEATANRYFAGGPIPISPLCWSVLAVEDDRTAAERLADLGGDAGALAAELFALWQSRAVLLRPRAFATHP